MMKKLISATLLFLSQSFNAFAGDDDAIYREALLKELNNRTLAGRVVTALADVHRGTPQGDFWKAYSELEAWQWPLYRKQAELHGLTPGGWLLTLKAEASVLFARALPDTFIGMLAEATPKYLAELESVTPAPGEQAFWSHVITQERVQAMALQHASQQDYVSARTLLTGLLENPAPAPR